VSAHRSVGPKARYAFIKITLVSFHGNESAIVAEEARPLAFIAESDAIKQITASCGEMQP